MFASPEFFDPFQKAATSILFWHLFLTVASIDKELGSSLSRNDASLLLSTIDTSHVVNSNCFTYVFVEKISK